MAQETKLSVWTVDVQLALTCLDAASVLDRRHPAGFFLVTRLEGPVG